jgi:hypothetical protein
MINNIIRTILLQASLPACFWAEALLNVTHILNRLPSKAIKSLTPYEALVCQAATYDHLRVFGCRCYPNLSSTTSHKLASQSTECVLLGYPTNHKRYRCLDLTTNQIITSQHVVFDEHSFPYSIRFALDTNTYRFLDDDAEDTPMWPLVPLSHTSLLPVVSTVTARAATSPSPQDAPASTVPNHFESAAHPASSVSDHDQSGASTGCDPTAPPVPTTLPMPQSASTPSSLSTTPPANQQCYQQVVPMAIPPTSTADNVHTM